MTEREDEMTRAINERAQRLINGEPEPVKTQENTGKTYADFKAAQKPQGNARERVAERQSSSARVERRTFENQQRQADALGASEQGPMVAPITSQEKVVKTFAAYGGFWRRRASSFLDYLPLYIAAIPVYVYLVIYFFALLAGDSTRLMEMRDEHIAILIIAAVVGVLNIAYNIYLYYKKGQTLGYQMLGMKVISQISGTKPQFGTLLGRAAFKIILLMVPFVNYIYYIVTAFMIGLRKDKKAPHDLVANTLVVSKEIKRRWLVWLTNIFMIVVPVVVLTWAVFISLSVISGDKHFFDLEGIYSQEYKQERVLKEINLDGFIQLESGEWVEDRNFNGIADSEESLEGVEVNEDDEEVFEG